MNECHGEAEGKGPGPSGPQLHPRDQVCLGKAVHLPTLHHLICSEATTVCVLRRAVTTRTWTCARCMEPLSVGPRLHGHPPTRWATCAHSCHMHVGHGCAQRADERDSQVGGAQTEHGAIWDNGSGSASHPIISFCLLLPVCLAFQVHMTT